MPPKIEDLTGRRFGRLVVLRLSGHRRHGVTYWECQCDCGNKYTVGRTGLMRGTTSCGCYTKEVSLINKIKDITGQRFGKLTTLKMVKIDKKRGCAYLCLCDCGKEKNTPAGSLMSGLSRSCGCLQFLSNQLLNCKSKGDLQSKK